MALHVTWRAGTPCARGAPAPAHRGGHASRTPERPPCARATVARARDPIGVPSFHNRDDDECRSGAALGDETNPTWPAAFRLGSSVRQKNESESRMRFSQDLPERETLETNGEGDSTADRSPNSKILKGQG